MSIIIEIGYGDGARENGKSSHRGVEKLEDD